MTHNPALVDFNCQLSTKPTVTWEDKSLLRNCLGQASLGHGVGLSSLFIDIAGPSPPWVAPSLCSELYEKLVGYKLACEQGRKHPSPWFLLYVFGSDLVPFWAEGIAV